MTEYELRDLTNSITSNIISMSAQQADYIAIYVSIVFAFIAASYVVGREFNKVQTTVATALFCVVCLWLVYRITTIGIGISFMIEVNNREYISSLVEDGKQFRDVIEGDVRVWLTGAVWSLGVVGALVFLWDIRHRHNRSE